MKLHRRARVDAEDGATTVLVALLLSGVMVGMLVLAAGTGQVLWERRQVQNAADATSLLLAKICAKKVTDCDLGSPSTSGALASLANANAADALNSVGPPCGRVPGAPNLPSCSSASSDADIRDLTACPPLPQWLRGNSIKYVETYSASQSDQGPFVKLPFGSGEAQLRSCARAAWGPPSSAATTLPFTVSFCEFNRAKNEAGGLYPTAELALPLKYKNDLACAHAPSGGDFNGGFGWLTQSQCSAQVLGNGWVAGSTGVGSGNSCTTQLVSMVGKDVLVPVFDCVSNTAALPCATGLANGNNAEYHIRGFATFHLTALDVTGQIRGGTPSTSAQAMCAQQSSDSKCIYGYFKAATLTQQATIDPSAEFMGTYVIKPAG